MLRVPFRGELVAPVRSFVPKSLVLAAMLVASAARTGAAQRSQSSITISATIAARVETMAPAELAPQLRTSAARPMAPERKQAVAPAASQTARASSPRYRVRLLLDSGSDSASAVFVRDADNRERSVGTSGVTIARQATAAEAQAAVVRLRVGTGAPTAGASPEVHLVYEVTSESSLAM